MGSDGAIPTDVAFELLASKPRRLVLSYLFEENRSATREELAYAVAERSTDAPLDGIPQDVLEDIHIALFHVHLPKLEDEGVVSWDMYVDDVALTARADELKPVLRTVSRQDAHRRASTD